MKRKYHSWAEVMDLREVKSLKKVKYFLFYLFEWNLD